MGTSEHPRQQSRHQHVEPSIKPILATMAAIVGAFLLMLGMWRLAFLLG